MFTRDTICEYTLALCTQCTQPLLKNATKPYFTWVAGVYISGLSDVHRMYTHVHTLMCFGHKTARKSGNLRVYVLWNGFGFSKGICPCFQRLLTGVRREHSTLHQQCADQQQRHPAPRKGAFRMLNYSASSFSTLASLTQMQNSSIAFVSSATLG